MPNKPTDTTPGLYTSLERNLMGLAAEAGLDVDAFKAAMLADAKWHRGDHETDWSKAPYPGAVIDAIRAYLNSTS